MLYLREYALTCMNASKVYERSGYEFENDSIGAYGKIWRHESVGGNEVFILKSQK